MKLDKLTLGVFFGLFALLMIFDVWTLTARGYDTTVSWTLYEFAKQWPIVPFAFGVMIGHLLWTNRAGGK